MRCRRCSLCHSYSVNRTCGMVSYERQAKERVSEECQNMCIGIEDKAGGQSLKSEAGPQHPDPTSEEGWEKRARHWRTHPSWPLAGHRRTTDWLHTDHAFLCTTQPRIKRHPAGRRAPHPQLLMSFTAALTSFFLVLAECGYETPTTPTHHHLSIPPCTHLPISPACLCRVYVSHTLSQKS